MDNQAQIPDLATLKGVAEAAKASGCELSEILGDTSAMYTAQGALIDFCEAATPAAVLALIADNTRLANCAHRSLAESAAMVGALTEILRVTKLGDPAFGIACLVLGELSAHDGGRA